MRIFYFLFFPLSWTINALPLSARLWMGSLLGDFWFYLIRFRRKIVLENLDQIFGDRWSEAQIQNVARENFRHYGKMLVEIFQSLSWSARDFQANIQVDGWENIKPYLERGEGVFLITCHYGNWELLIGSGVANGVPADVVIKRPRWRWVSSLLRWYRTERMGVGLIPETASAKDILRAIRNGRCVPIIFDQFMGPPIGLPVNFLGKTAGTMVSLALLTERTKAEVLPIYSYRDLQGKLHTVLEPPIEMPPLSPDKNVRLYQRTNRYNQALEKIVSRSPEQWLWLHRRWKPYRGEPKWKPRFAEAGVGLVLLLTLFGCISPRESQKGDISLQESPAEHVIPELPPAPKVVVPTIVSEKPVEEPKKKTEKLTVTESPEPVFLKRAVENYPFSIGERLTLVLRWTAIPAGEAIMEVKEGNVIEGRPTFKFWGAVHSNRVVDLIYRVNNSVETWVDKEAFLPYEFQLLQDEKEQVKRTRVIYNHKEGQANFTAERISKRWGDHSDARVDKLVPGAQDLWSALYYVRLLDFKVGQKQKLFVYENGKNYEVELEPLSSEVIRTSLGAFSCWKIEVHIKLENVLKPTGKVYMWLSSDAKRYLVRFDAKIKIGNLNGELVGIEE